jgi:phosphotransferase system IIB component
LVIKDIIKGEGCETELKLTQEKVIKLVERETQKDTIISLLESKDKNNQYIIGQQNQQIDLYKNMTDDLKKEIKQSRTKTFLYKVGTLVGIITTSYLLLVR